MWCVNVQNIRKIIEERLENARNDYKYYQEGNSEFYEYGLFEISGQIEAYQDCLNLIPAPKTEQEILKDFEKLGYVIVDNNKYELILVKDMKFHLIINKELKHYMVVALTPILTLQEHKLLNELFICWGWL